ncbi:putative Holliday junction resolvase, partial [Yersinia pestis PY-08]|jgi:hypothetical protein
MAAP